MELSDRDEFVCASLSKSPNSFRQFVVESCERVCAFDETLKKDENNKEKDEKVIEDGVRMILIEAARLNVQRDEFERTVKEDIFVLSGETKQEEEEEERKQTLTRTSEALVDGLYPFVESVRKILEDIDNDEKEVYSRGETSRGIKQLESCEVRVDAVVAEKNSSEYRVRLENRWRFAKEDNNGLKRRSELRFACSEGEGEMLSNALKEALRAAENARL
jgi:hypothetical protein